MQFRAHVLSPEFNIIRKYTIEAEFEFDVQSIAKEKFTAEFGDDPELGFTIKEIT